MWLRKWRKLNAALNAVTLAKLKMPKKFTPPKSTEAKGGHQKLRPLESNAGISADTLRKLKMQS